MSPGPHHESRHQPAAPEPSADRLAVARRPTPAQRRYLERGLTQPGGKLPLFDRNGREVAKQTIESCIAQGWAVPWVHNPIKPGWLVCRLSVAGYRVLGGEPPTQGTAGATPAGPDEH